MKRCFITMRWLLSFGLVLGASACHSANQHLAPMDPPNAKDVTSLLAFLQANALCLSSDAHSAASQFEVHLRWSGRQIDEATPNYECIVARDGDRATIVVLSPSGLPYCYMTNGLLVLMTANGKAMALTTGSPSIRFKRIAEEDRFEATAWFSKDSSATSIDIDLGSIIQGLTQKAIHTEVTADGRTIRLKTNRADAVIGLRESESGFPLSSLSVQSNTGAFAIVSEILVNGTAAMPRLTLQNVRNAGIDVQERVPTELKDIVLTVPDNFASDAAMQRCAWRLASLLKLPRGPAGAAQ